jgi:hypothetical protein
MKVSAGKDVDRHSPLLPWAQRFQLTSYMAPFASLYRVLRGRHMLLSYEVSMDGPTVAIGFFAIGAGTG